jgi:acyl-[acyl-carrier-protein]-phospholipid O-acyltransferase/long-chain-fatty-acid--[acyl-carrier-protein] ligase
MGAANDNILKQVLTFMVATGIWSGSFDEGGLPGGQTVVALCLTIPFIFVSGFGGQVADRFSKRRVMLWVKLAEIPIALTATVGFMTRNLWLTLFALVLLAIQSSFFGPAKYGVIPELIKEKHLSMANGLINMFTNLAVILGSMAAGPVADLYHPDEGASPVLWAPGALLLVVALLGLVSVIPMPKVAATNAKLKFELNPFRLYFRTIREMAKSPLLVVALAWSGFYMIGMMALLIIPEYQEILDISYTQSSNLLGFLGVAIAAGSVTTGVISGATIRPWLIPLGAIGMTLSFLMLGTLTPSYMNVSIFIFSAGFSAGFYIVPLQALMQRLASDEKRGQILGTANALSFVFTSIGSVIFWLAKSPMGMAPNRIHLICGTLAFIGTVVGVIQIKRLTSNIAMLENESD